MPLHVRHWPMTCLLALLSTGCATAPTAQYVLEPLPLTQVPALPSTCGTAATSQNDRVLIMISSNHCAPCRRLRRALTADHKTLAQRGIQVIELVKGTRDCLAARRVSGPRPYPVTFLGRQDTRAWPAASTPTLYLLRHGQVIAYAQGVVPIHVLLQWFDARGLPQSSRPHHHTLSYEILRPDDLQ